MPPHPGPLPRWGEENMGKGKAHAARRRGSVIARPRAVLFDWDNTLVDSWATIHHALNIVMTAMDMPQWSLAETKSRVRLSLRESFPRHFGARWEEARRI